MGFICHVEHPHKFISNYLATLGTPPELRQEASNLANDRYQVPLPEDPPWWKAFDADKSGIDEVCRVLAHLYTLPKAQYIPVCKERGSFATSNQSWDSQHESVAKDGSLTGPAANEDGSTAKGSSSAVNQEVDVLVKAALDKMKELKSADDSKSMPTGEELREDPKSKSISDHRTEVGRKKEQRAEIMIRGRESDRERRREDSEKGRDKIKEKGHRSRDKGNDFGQFDVPRNQNITLLEIENIIARLTHQGRRIATNIIRMHKLS
ncbi:Cyclin-L1-1 [Olea europaea subsp. europaea]|uniref:Cyclin-L1-1 n=1 Tax=Olea europaea subsp. europaea TaxID=158383 RepID=A0A8S0VE60_OLEEU|nr:Cyclin-L1-1 [Olea europaea subsp. europaea]